MLDILRFFCATLLLRSSKSEERIVTSHLRLPISECLDQRQISAPSAVKKSVSFQDTRVVLFEDLAQYEWRCCSLRRSSGRCFGLTAERILS